MIKVGFGEMYDNASYGIEQNVLHRSLPPLRYVRDLRSHRLRILCMQRMINARCVKC